MNAFEKLPELYAYIRPLVDIGILAFILYKVYGIIVKTQSLQIIKFGCINRFCHCFSAGITKNSIQIGANAVV